MAAPDPQVQAAPLRILVADADRDMCTEIQRLIQADIASAQYAIATTGQEALGFMKSGKVDLAFVDVALPGISGLDVVREARKAQANPFTVMTSSVALPNWAIVASDLFLYEFLKKPFASEDVSNIARARQRMLQPTRILLVDSSSQARHVMGKMIRASRFLTEVEETESGIYAMKLARLKSYDIVLMDIALSGMGGLETACQLKAIYPDLQVVMMNGGTETNLAPALKQFGLKMMMKKPFWTRDCDFMMHHFAGIRRPYLMNATCPVDKRAFSVIA